jgi:hypothetical protein
MVHAIQQHALPSVWMQLVACNTATMYALSFDATSPMQQCNNVLPSAWMQLGACHTWCNMVPATLQQYIAFSMQALNCHTM